MASGSGFLKANTHFLQTKVSESGHCSRDCYKHFKFDFVLRCSLSLPPAFPARPSTLPAAATFSPSLQMKRKTNVLLCRSSRRILGSPRPFRAPPSFAARGLPNARAASPAVASPFSDPARRKVSFGSLNTASGNQGVALRTIIRIIIS